MVILRPAVAALRVPALVSVLPLTFIVMLLFDATVTLALTSVAALVVVVTAPPLRLRVVAPAPEAANVRLPEPVGATAIVPPVVARVPAKPLGMVITKLTLAAELPESTAMADAPLAVMDGLAVVAAKVMF